MSAYDSAKFKALNKQWRKKLEASGFEDAEYENGFLKRYHKQFFDTRVDWDAAPMKEEHFRKASQFLHVHKFKTKAEYKIWELYSEGVSKSEISRRLKWHRTNVCRAIVRTMEAMKAWLDKSGLPDEQD